MWSFKSLLSQSQIVTIPYMVSTPKWETFLGIGHLSKCWEKWEQLETLIPHKKVRPEGVKRTWFISGSSKSQLVKEREIFHLLKVWTSLLFGYMQALTSQPKSTPAHRIQSFRSFHEFSDNKDTIFRAKNLLLPFMVLLL